MADSVDDDHLFLVIGMLERVLYVNQQIQDVQWEPSDVKYEGDSNQQAVPSPKSLYINY